MSTNEQLDDEVLALRTLVRDAIIHAEHGDYSNGVKGPCGDMDEGDIRGREYLDDLNKRAEALGVNMGQVGDDAGSSEPGNCPPSDRPAPDYKVWECKIVLAPDTTLPTGFDSPPRRAAIEAVE